MAVRRACFGEMVQLNGSHHDWLEGRGCKLVLLAYIYARFYDYEGTILAMDSFKGCEDVRFAQQCLPGQTYDM